MTLSQKLEILIKRKGITKTETAARLGITYRCLANYISGDRRPRTDILVKIAKLLDVTPQFLLDNKQKPILTSEESFILSATSPESAVNSAVQLIHDMRKTCGELTPEDKQALFSCLSEIYFG